jgi:glycosyltransferase involved in cell wall biosynthesis
LLKVSIITACHNNAATIQDTLYSVASQTYAPIEHIVIDGLSSDGTAEIVKQATINSSLISEKDNGIYEALNKGLKLAIGEIVGFLHADDYFHHATVIEEIASYFDANPNVSAIYGDIVFINEQGKNIRYYSSKKWQLSKMAQGIMPAHPSFFARKEVYKKYPFDTQFSIAADFNQVLQVALDKSFAMHYLPIITTCMRKGGKSTKNLQSNIKINQEILKICRANGIKTNYWRIYSKYPGRLLELLRTNG